ncbi:glycerophosphodiester phosphodiesterase family protein [Stutzerimonas tarimensis]|uniref:glycerophosphodiester phosphodiesterase n=1 Tax=Stutzerimonas tarimensis TaxID=1507735 RepID=A0ABV7T4W1_9GAMM
MRWILTVLLLLCLQPTVGAADAIETAIAWAEREVGPDRARPAGGPLVIAHRGASGDAPEHTLEAYALAVLQGADHLEVDLVSSADGVLIARHENELGLTTDVAERPEFAERRKRRLVDRQYRRGWFSEDFTLAEIRQLQAKERMPTLRPANSRVEGRVATLEEIIRLTKRLEAREGRPIGLYLETKHARHFARRGLPLEAPLAELLAAHGYTSAEAPVFLQSFERSSLERLRDLTPLRRVQLIGRRYPADQPLLARQSFRRMASARGLAEVASYAHAVGPEKGYVIPRDRDGRLTQPSDFVGHARAAGLQVHPYTFRAENRFLPTGLRLGPHDHQRGDLKAELSAFLAAGVDGLIIDHPAIAVRLLQQSSVRTLGTAEAPALLSFSSDRHRDIE